MYFVGGIQLKQVICWDQTWSIYSYMNFFTKPIITLLMKSLSCCIIFILGHKKTHSNILGSFNRRNDAFVNEEMASSVSY